MPSKVTEDAEGGWVTSSDLTSEYVSLVNVSEVALACRSHNPASDWVVSESRVITVTSKWERLYLLSLLTRGRRQDHVM